MKSQVVVVVVVVVVGWWWWAYSSHSFADSSINTDTYIYMAILQYIGTRKF